MNKNYIIVTGIILVIVGLFSYLLYFMDKKEEEKINSMLPRIGQKVLTYNMNERAWHDYNDKTDIDSSKEIIILQVQEPVGNGGYTSYHLITGNILIPKKDVLIGEGSREFIRNKKLYSYFPKTYEFYEIVFNGTNFKPRKLTEKEIQALFKDFEIIKVSTLEKGTLTLNYSKHKNKFMVLNDSRIEFYKYYVVPNESKKMKIGEFSNQIIVKDDVNVMIQRMEGCSKNFPCYEIKFK